MIDVWRNERLRSLMLSFSFSARRGMNAERKRRKKNISFA
jgi:hypothetical protein